MVGIHRCIPLVTLVMPITLLPSDSPGLKGWAVVLPWIAPEPLLGSWLPAALGRGR